MNGGVQIERKAFDRALRDFERDTGLGAHDVLTDAMQSMLRGAVRAMPPKTAKVGKDAIRRDLSSVLGELSSKPALNKFHEMFGDRLWPLQFEDNLYVASAWAEKYRGKRGRIKYRASPVTMKGTGTTFSGKMYTTKRNKNTILRAKMAHVGMAKAGFRMAAKKFGLRFPTWIDRHGSAPGYGRDTWRPGKADWYLEAVNAVPHAARHRALVERSLHSTQNQMVHSMDRMLARIAKKHSAR